MRKLLNYVVPALLAVLMFTSNFLQTNIFNFGENLFAVWFVLSVLCFACGWYINKTIGWHTGGKVVFTEIIAISFLSILIIIFFREYFGANQPTAENMILYTLRNITLGSMALFGMAVAEVITTRKDFETMEQKLAIYESRITDIDKESENLVKEAKLKAEKIIQSAELEAKNTILYKERIERELKDFIQTEKELIKKYESI